MDNVTLLYSTAPDEKAADEIATALVAEGAAACVNIVPGMRSVYRWEGKVETANEVMLFVKTTAASAGRAGAIIRRLHPYDVPAITALTVDENRSSDEFCDWVRNSCAAK